MRYLLVLLSSILVHAVLAWTPQPFVQSLQDQRVGCGFVTVNEDEEIGAFPLYPSNPVAEVPHEVPSTASPSAPVDGKVMLADSTSQRVPDTYTGTRVRHKQRGFRIQLYSGTGSGTAKKAAKQMEAKVRRTLPELSVYCHFKSPRWICRVGDFATREEAQRYLAKIRSLKISSEASIVPDDVFVVN